MLKIATSCLGISVFDYYEMTPYELYLMLEGQFEKYKNDIEMYAVASRVAIINAMNRKSYKVFGKQNSLVEIIDPKEKKKELDQLKNIFS